MASTKLNRKITQVFTADGPSDTNKYLTISGKPEGSPSVSISGTNGATVALERSLDNGVNFGPVETYTTDFEDKGVDTTKGAVYRVVVSGYVSGDLTVTMQD